MNEVGGLGVVSRRPVYGGTRSAAPFFRQTGNAVRAESECGYIYWEELSEELALLCVVCV